MQNQQLLSLNNSITSTPTCSLDSSPRDFVMSLWNMRGNKDPRTVPKKPQCYLREMYLFIFDAECM